jgi:uncharacterized alpha-E superfamily protein
MLCRTASDLYWLSRHIERMDNTARIIDLAHRIAMLPERHGTARDVAAPWARALEALGLDEAYAKRHGAPTRETVLQYLLFEESESSSVVSCMRAARESGRAQRGAITADMYEDLNTSWLRVRELDADAFARQGLTPFLEWLKRRSASFRGVTVGTMGRDEAYEFLRLGTFIERADFGVRLLDVNFGKKRAARAETGATEYYEMSALLQALSAFETFRKIYRDAVTAERVAELVILRADMPRSLAICTAAIQDVLHRLLGSRASEAARLAGVLAAKTRYGRIDEILDNGIDAYLERFLEQLYRLADEINREFMMPTDVIAA